MNGSSPLPASSRQFAEMVCNRSGASAMVILCWLQKSRTWHCAASQRLSESSFSSRSVSRNAFPRAKDAWGVYLNASPALTRT
jgi:hypothetical protein